MEGNFKTFTKKYQDEIYLVLVLVFISIISFNLGRIYTAKQFDQPIRVEEASIGDIFKNSDKQQETSDNQSDNKKLSQNQKIDFKVVASKNGTKYHFIWCPGAKKISQKNLITFASEQEAQAKGYTLAGNCQK